MELGAELTTSDDSSFRFIDLFAGIGGMRLPFDAIGGKCVFTSEWDKYCQQTYRRNFTVDHMLVGNIKAVPLEDIPRFDLLVAGFPCQPFSIAGVSKKNALGRPHGFECERQGNLFFNIADILEHHHPPAFILENVRNLQSHDGGRTFQVILDVLREDLGYTVSTRIIDARSWVPQHRERIFIVGFKKDIGFDLHQMPIPDPSEGPRMRSILHGLDEEPDGRFLLEKGVVNPKYTLTKHLWSYLKDYADKHRAKGNGFGFGLVDGDGVSRTLSARYYKDGSEILVDQGRKGPRRLTPRECARLMGFHRLDGVGWEIPVSDTQAYKQFGNAVVVPAVEAVARYMLPYLRRAVAGNAAPTVPLSWGDPAVIYG